MGSGWTAEELGQMGPGESEPERYTGACPETLSLGRIRTNIRVFLFSCAREHIQRPMSEVSRPQDWLSPLWRCSERKSISSAG